VGARGRGGRFMPVVIPDEALREAGLNPREALVEFACRPCDAGKLMLLCSRED